MIAPIAVSQCSSLPRAWRENSYERIHHSGVSSLINRLERDIDSGESDYCRGQLGCRDI